MVKLKINGPLRNATSLKGTARTMMNGYVVRECDGGCGNKRLLSLFGVVDEYLNMYMTCAVNK